MPRDRGIVFGAVRELRTSCRDRDGFPGGMTLRYSSHAAGQRPDEPLPAVPPRSPTERTPTVVVHRGNHALLESLHPPRAALTRSWSSTFRSADSCGRRRRSFSRGRRLSVRRRGEPTSQRHGRCPAVTSTPWSRRTFWSSYRVSTEGFALVCSWKTSVFEMRFEACSRLRRKHVASSFPTRSMEPVRLFDGLERMSFERDLGHPPRTRRCFEFGGEWTTSRVGCRCSRRVCDEAGDVDHRGRWVRRRPGRAGVVPSQRRRGRHSRRRRRHRRRRSNQFYVSRISRLGSPRVGHERSDGARAPHEPGTPRRDRARRGLGSGLACA